MEIEKKYIQSPGTICICVDDYDPYNILGRLYHPGNELPLYFNEIGRALIETDRILDEQRFPQSSTAGRSFSKQVRVQTKAKESTPMQKKLENQQKGGKGTFVVQVQYRQNATWQGKVLWAEKNESMPFRSALELLKLIDSALDENLQTSDKRIQ